MKNGCMEESESMKCDPDGVELRSGSGHNRLSGVPEPKLYGTYSRITTDFGVGFVRFPAISGGRFFGPIPISWWPARQVVVGSLEHSRLICPL